MSTKKAHPKSLGSVLIFTIETMGSYSSQLQAHDRGASARSEAARLTLDRPMEER
ncbi:MAG: hypothetical protein F6K62_19305 [Sphaerospermopsis sp. SIO1G2]|nr:hypothetical protein [Sphaerospermopsis sp. SIO1G2]